MQSAFAGGRERGGPALRGAHSRDTRLLREHKVGLFADRTRQQRFPFLSTISEV
jgi:hypothetical protein